MNTLNKLVLAGFLVFGALLVVGCNSGSGSSGSTASHPSTYVGTFAGSSGVSGTISLTITPPSVAVQSAVMPLGVTPDFVLGGIHVTGGGDIMVSGTFTPSRGPLNVSGGGYTLTGTRSNGVLSGSFTGPGGTSGPFAALVSSSSQPADEYCGTFSGSDAGPWSVSLAGTKLVGSYAGGEGSGVLIGTLSGEHVSLTFANGTATGTLDVKGLTMSGTWTTNGGSQSGAWTGSSLSCD